jgi:hypothetical protein
MTLATAYKCAFHRLPFSETSHIRDEISGVDVYLGKVDDYQVIVCWGSTELRDWITDFKFFFKRWRRPSCAREDSPIRVHGGYLDGWEAIRMKVLPFIISDKVLVTGYSMGGGLSSIIAIDVQYNLHPTDLVCVDFDGPRVWNDEGRASFNRRVPRSYKVAYGNDIVPKVPPFYCYGGLRLRIGSKWKWWKLSVKDHLFVIQDSIMVDLLDKCTAESI